MYSIYTTNLSYRDITKNICLEVYITVSMLKCGMEWKTDSETDLPENTVNVLSFLCFYCKEIFSDKTSPFPVHILHFIHVLPIKRKYVVCT